jgi:cytoskeletal protein CcmA (bactofilin family)
LARSGERPDVRQTAAATVIAREARVEGQVSGASAVRIEGHLKGSIRLEAPLEILEGAEVEADVQATSVRVAGAVTGNVSGTKLVELLATAVVKGDVTAPALHVVEGAKLEGRVQMRVEKTAGQSPD